MPIEHAGIVGDSIRDRLAARRCRGLAVGLLSGGYGTEELERSGAVRIRDDPAMLLDRLDEVDERRRGTPVHSWLVRHAGSRSGEPNFDAAS